MSEGPVFVAADPAALERALAEAPVATGLARPGPGRYLGDLGIRLFRAVEEWVEGLLPSEQAVLILERVVVWSLVAVAVLVVVLVAVRLLRRLRARPAPPAGAAAAVAAVAAPPVLDPAAHWRRAEEALAAGDLRRAAEALWWWAALRLAPREVAPSWTSGDLLAAARRPELAPAFAELDRAQYAPTTPDAGTLRRLAGRLREAVP